MKIIMNGELYAHWIFMINFICIRDPCNGVTFVLLWRFLMEECSFMITFQKTIYPRSCFSVILLQGRNLSNSDSNFNLSLTDQDGWDRRASSFKRVLLVLCARLPYFSLFHSSKCSRIELKLDLTESAVGDGSGSQSLLKYIEYSSSFSQCGLKCFFFGLCILWKLGPGEKDNKSKMVRVTYIGIVDRTVRK